MTPYGRYNLLALVGMPVAAVLAAAITPALDKPYAATFVSVFVMNLIPMLIAAAATGLLLRGSRKAGGAGASVALWPAVGTAAVGAVWYLGRALVPDPVAPGVEYIAGPQELLMLAVALSVVAWIASRVVRARRAVA
jgi:hypothetical protein